MSLIYQALQQMQQQGAALPAPGTPAPPRGRPATRQRLPLWLRHGAIGRGLFLAALGTLLGAGLSQWLAPARTPPAPLGAAPAAAPAQAPAAVPAPALAALPRAAPQRPVFTGPLRPTYALQLPAAASAAPDRPQPAPRAAPAAPAAAAATAAPAAAEAVPARLAGVPQQPVLAAAAPVEQAAPLVLPSPAETVQQPFLATADLFESLNRALAESQPQAARQHLTQIQARLPPASLARWRAEAWFAHQGGDLEGAARIYRQLLLKLPGDEHTAVNLASIEKRRGRLDDARAVLSGALRQQPASSLLRQALEQLALERALP